MGLWPELEFSVRTLLSLGQILETEFPKSKIDWVLYFQTPFKIFAIDIPGSTAKDGLTTQKNMPKNTKIFTIRRSIS